MGSDWMDEFSGADFALGDDSTDGFYCPYTNGAECALISRGWQPQELCDALECEQLKLFDRRHRRRNEAA